MWFCPGASVARIAFPISHLTGKKAGLGCGWKWSEVVKSGSASLRSIHE